VSTADITNYIPDCADLAYVNTTLLLALKHGVCIDPKMQYEIVNWDAISILQLIQAAVANSTAASSYAALASTSSPAVSKSPAVTTSPASVASPAVKARKLLRGPSHGSGDGRGTSAHDLSTRLLRASSTLSEQPAREAASKETPHEDGNLSAAAAVAAEVAGVMHTAHSMLADMRARPATVGRQQSQIHRLTQSKEAAANQAEGSARRRLQSARRLHGTSFVIVTTKPIAYTTGTTTTYSTVSSFPSGTTSDILLA
jgi:hypothetical protein